MLEMSAPGSLEVPSDGALAIQGQLEVRFFRVSLRTETSVLRISVPYIVPLRVFLAREPPRAQLLPSAYSATNLGRSQCAGHTCKGVRHYKLTGALHEESDKRKSETTLVVVGQLRSGCRFPSGFH